MSEIEKIMLTIILGSIKHNIETSKSIDDTLEKARKGCAEGLASFSKEFNRQLGCESVLKRINGKRVRVFVK